MNASHLSFGIIVLIVLFWLILVFRITVIRYFKLKKTDDASETGRPVQGTITTLSRSGSGRFKAIRMQVEFPNFSNTLIKEEFRFVDSKPEENRYEEGRKVMLLLDEKAKNGPTVKLSGGRTVIGKGFMLFSALLIFGAIYGTSELYKITYTKLGGNWSRTDLLFENNDAMPVMGIVFIGVLVFQFFLFKWIGKITGISKSSSDRELKFYGEKTMASITRYEDTNVTINNNPKVRFYYTFSDSRGANHSGKDEVVVGKLEIGNLPNMKEKEIFYLPQNPSAAKFTENLNPNSLSGCLNVVLIFEALIFSVVLLAAYLGSL